MAGKDWFAEIARNFGPLRHLVKVTPQDAMSYVDRVPHGLINFWLDHGRGQIGETEEWICDPATFAPLINFIFKDDPEFKPADFAVVSYEAFATMTLWHRTRGLFNLGVDASILTNLGTMMYDPKTGEYVNYDRMTKHTSRYDPARPEIDSKTGLVLTADQKLGRAFYPTSFVIYHDDDGGNLYERAVAKLGPLQPGEIYGTFPARQLGGIRNLENLRRARLLEYGLIAAQIRPFEYQMLTPPDPPSYPLGGTYTVRLIGPQSDTPSPNLAPTPE